MNTLLLCLEKDVALFVRTPRGVEEKTFSEIFVLRGTTPADKDIPKGAGFQWDSQARYWWTANEAIACKLSCYAQNGLRERWGMTDAAPPSTPIPETQIAAQSDQSTPVIGTPQQEAFWREVAEGNSHLVLEARAGCGKTFSIIEAARRARESRIGFSAFNKHIAEELQEKIPTGAKAFTLHSLGFTAIRRAFSKVEVDAGKGAQIVREIYPDAAQNKAFAGVVCKLTSLCKSYLSDGSDPIALNEIALRHDVDLTPAGRSEIGADVYRERVFAAVPRVLLLMRERTATVDMDDMVWLPVVLDLSVGSYDLLFIDESQDMNLCQQRLSFMACPAGRIVIVGDPRQAIYAFRGADTRSMARMAEQLEATARGCKTLPLTLTRRCPKAHVRLAQEIVPDIEAMPEAPEGALQNIQMDKIAARALPREMVICRVNAPLISVAHNLLRLGKKPVVKGRDIGASIRDLLKKLDATTIPQLAAALTEYSQAEGARLAAAGKDDALIRLQDRVTTLEVLMEGCSGLGQLETKMAQLFDAKDDGDSVVLASVHSCKGLEAETVYILKPELMPHPKATRPEDAEQEQNIRYVALTRSKATLVFAHEYWKEDAPEQGEVEPQNSEPRPDENTAAKNAQHIRYDREGEMQVLGVWEKGDWRGLVRALLSEAYDKTPFDESAVLDKIEAAIAALPSSASQSLAGGVR